VSSGSIIFELQILTTIIGTGHYKKKGSKSDKLGSTSIVVRAKQPGIVTAEFSLP
jgi:hypothetical protein